MLKTKLVTWAVIAIAFISWNVWGYLVSDWLYETLTQIGIPVLIVHLLLPILPLVILLEIIVKLLLIRALPAAKFVPIQADSCQFIDQDELTRYTIDLENLGFIRLTDYAVDSTQSMARLFGHPQSHCFAEVGKVANLPMFCTVSSHLEQHWFLGVTNMNSPNSAISYAFLRQPRTLVKSLETESVGLLFESLLTWREQILNDLALKPIQTISAETYFEQERNRRIAPRNHLRFKSVIWCLLEMFWFSLNPKSDWLGDYEKVRSKS